MSSSIQDISKVDLARLRLTKQTVELGTVAADGVRLSLDNPPTRLRAREQRVKFRVRHLQLTRLEFEGTNLPGKIDLTVKGMDAGWTSDDGVPTGFARIDEVDLRAPGINPIKVALAARLLINDGLQIPSWTVTADGIDLHGTGRLAGSDGTSFTAAGSVDLESLDHIVRAGGILDGDIDVEATFDLAADEFVRAEIEGRHLSAAVKWRARATPRDDAGCCKARAQAGLRPSGQRTGCAPPRHQHRSHV